MKALGKYISKYLLTFFVFALVLLLVNILAFVLTFSGIVSKRIRFGISGEYVRDCGR